MNCQDHLYIGQNPRDITRRFDNYRLPSCAGVSGS